MLKGKTKLTKADVLAALMADVSGELGAITQYQKHIDDINDEEIKTVLSHIRDDEKEHFAELIKLIRKRDATQDEKFRKMEL